MRALFFVIWLFASLPLLGEGIQKETYRSTISTSRYEVLDLTFRSSYNRQLNPFIVDFEAMVTAPSGKSMRVPGFYNGDKEWIIRFSADEEGIYKYVTSSEIKTLNNKKGSIKVGPNTAPDKKGGVVISKQHPRYFEYQDGSPYFLMAYECDWLYALDYKNEQGIPRTWKLLEQLEENGFNQVVMNVFSYDIDAPHAAWTKDEKLKDFPQYDFGAPQDIFPFLGNNEQPDFSRLNVAFFQKLDRTISALNDKNIVAHLMIYVWNKKVNWPDMYTEADDMYYDYIVKRYGAFPNMLFDVSKEAILYGRADDEYILERIQRIRDNNPFDRLVTVHDYGFCVRHKEKVDFLSRQDWKFRCYDHMIETHRKVKDKPVFNIEHGGYEYSDFEVFPGSYMNAESCLRRNYECLFAGIYSTYYWQGASWNVIVWDPEQLPKEYYRPKYQYFKYLTDFFSTYNFADYAPLELKGRIQEFCLKHNDKEEYLFYIPKELYRKMTWGIMKDDEEVIHYKWYNTLTGEMTTEFKKTKDTFGYQSPWHQEADAILILRRSSETVN
ncbi:DUF5060 domain-containing protein [Persicobacter diffluens]|uniref:DUF4038 domain-containing protein n=1 Tax=Persicobacter diffluens TaxID=981 RepID=A0AAN5AMJ0_9BACT|nr:hypothetical protein PEDI_29930 [Persicobacter diffluens]